MDSFTTGAVTVALSSDQKPMRMINLGSLMSGFDVEVLYEKLQDVKKPKYFDFMITTDASAPAEFSIDVVNGVEITSLSLEILSTDLDEENDEKSTHARVKIKPLIKQFKKGINTFEIAYGDGEERVAEEVLLQIEI